MDTKAEPCSGRKAEDAREAAAMQQNAQRNANSPAAMRRGIGDAIRDRKRPVGQLPQDALPMALPHARGRLSGVGWHMEDDSLLLNSRPYCSMVA